MGVPARVMGQRGRPLTDNACAGEIPMLEDVRGDPYLRHQDGDGNRSDECDRGADEADDQARCGDGRVEGQEICDDGNQEDGDGCSASCQSEDCGDGIIDRQSGEEREPGTGGPGFDPRGDRYWQDSCTCRDSQK